MHPAAGRSRGVNARGSAQRGPADGRASSRRTSRWPCVREREDASQLARRLHDRRRRVGERRQHRRRLELRRVRPEPGAADGRPDTARGWRRALERAVCARCGARAAGHRLASARGRCRRRGRPVLPRVPGQAVAQRDRGAERAPLDERQRGNERQREEGGRETAAHAHERDHRRGKTARCQPTPRRGADRRHAGHVRPAARSRCHEAVIRGPCLSHRGSGCAN